MGNFVTLTQSNIAQKNKNFSPSWTQREILNGIARSTQDWLQLG